MIDSLQLDREREANMSLTGARITYEQLKGGKTWFDADSLAESM
jgi:hypothetical protein